MYHLCSVEFDRVIPSNLNSSRSRPLEQLPVFEECEGILFVILNVKANVVTYFPVAQETLTQGSYSHSPCHERSSGSDFNITHGLDLLLNLLFRITRNGFCRLLVVASATHPDLAVQRLPPWPFTLQSTISRITYPQLQ